MAWESTPLRLTQGATNRMWWPMITRADKTCKRKASLISSEWATSKRWARRIRCQCLSNLLSIVVVGNVKNEELMRRYLTTWGRWFCHLTQISGFLRKCRTSGMSWPWSRTLFQRQRAKRALMRASTEVMAICAPLCTMKAGREDPMRPTTKSHPSHRSDRLRVTGIRTQTMTAKSR